MFSAQDSGDSLTAAAYGQGLELQADCLAGDWIRSEWDANEITQDDLDAAGNAAVAVGDDTIGNGEEFFPDAQAHGLSQDRLKWLNFGMSDGVPADCNTWSEPVEGKYTAGD
jgi:predicted metalloprotease